MSEAAVRCLIVPLRVPEDRFAAAMAASASASRAGLSRKTALQVALAAAELAANAVRHGHGGQMRLCFKASPHPRVEIQTADRGPGMGKGEKEFADGYSEGRVIGPDAPRARGQGLGVGLGTVRRLMDEVRITTDADGAHCIIAARWTER